MPARVPVVLMVVIAAALSSTHAAGACCWGCGWGYEPTCGSALYDVEPIPAGPLAPTYRVELGPTYHAVVVAEDEVERRLEFAHPHYFPYVHFPYAPPWLRVRH